MPTLIDRHALADALRDLAVDLDSGNVPQPDDPPRQFLVLNVRGWDLLVEQWPDGSVTLKHRDPLHDHPRWSAPLELEQVAS